MSRKIKLEFYLDKQLITQTEADVSVLKFENKIKMTKKIVSKTKIESQPKQTKRNTSKNKIIIPQEALTMTQPETVKKH